MSKKQDGGPAFPRTSGDWNLSSSGMTLRQYYAGLAMQGFLGEPLHTCSSWRGECELLGGGDDAWAPLARDAFDIADAMLAHEREEKS